MAGVPLAEPEGLLEPRKVSLKESANSTRDDLKPVVLTLAMLLLMTSICSWNCWMPLTPELRERSIIFFRLRIGSRRYGEHRAQIIGHIVDYDLRRPCLNIDGADRAINQVALVVLQGHR